MSTENRIIKVSGIHVQVVRKAIKNLHLGVYPPDGRVRVAVPLALPDSAVRLAVIGKLEWIKRQQRRFSEQERQSVREMVNGESHYFLGRRYRLRVMEAHHPPGVRLKGKSSIELSVRPDSGTELRRSILNDWYRKELKLRTPALIEKWQSITGIQIRELRIKKMKTKWGSFSRNAGRIWINLEMAKKPVVCVEYIILHEMLHFHEPHHNESFFEYLNQYMPQWRLYKAELNKTPLAYEKWQY
jgi:predicted metal-dependent hydrolase